MFMPPPKPPAPGNGFSLGGHSFTLPSRFPSAFIPPFAGIYAILVLDSGLMNQRFRVLYIGESSDIGKRITKHHEKLDDWIREASGKPLFFAYSERQSSTDQQRRDAECELIGRLNPPCNSRIPPFWSQVANLYGY